MRAVRIHGVNDVRVDEIEEPQPGPRDVIVRVRRCGLCGSDLGYIKVGGVSAPAQAPFGIGHELSGVVETVGADVVGIAPGQRVVVNPMGDGNGIGAGLPEGAFAPLLRVSNATLGGAIHPIPDHVDWDAAALAEPLGVALHAVNRSGAVRTDKVAVFGVGPIGLGIVFFLKRAGISSVVAIDRSPQRL
ncbi:MAG: zinc-dependent alcohol dehydrogenase, partial [Alphaproteobacteria bacterium]